MGILWVTWQLQSLGTAASSLVRVGAVKWLGGRPLVRQTGRDLPELHYVVVDAATWATVVFDDHVDVEDGWCAESAYVGSSNLQNFGVCGGFQETQAPMKVFFFCSPGVALVLSNEDMVAYGLDSLATTVSRWHVRP